MQGDIERSEMMETVKAKFCSQCGNRLPPNAAFCPICGKKIDSGREVGSKTPTDSDLTEVRGHSADAEIVNKGETQDREETLSPFERFMNKAQNGNVLDQRESVASYADKRGHSSINRPKKHFSLVGIVTIGFLGALLFCFFSLATQPPIAIASRSGLLSDKVLYVKNLSSAEDLYATIRFHNKRWTLGDKSIVIPANDEISLGALELGGYRPTVGDLGVIKIKGYSQRCHFELGEDGPVYGCLYW